MTALTLAMNELADVNSEEFQAVRAYHTYGNSFRHMNLTRNGDQLLSPASSHSSGISSLGTCDSEPRSKDTDSDSAETEQKQKPKDKDLAIVYEKRNILDLRNNVNPSAWQLTSPIFDFSIKSITNYKKVFCSTAPLPAYSMDDCPHCNFTSFNEPTPFIVKKLMLRPSLKALFL